MTRKRLLVIAALTSLVLAFIFFSNYGVITRLSLIAETSELEQHFVMLQKTADSLRREKHILETDSTEIERLAREHSIDPASKPLDGVIPPIPRYGGADELEKAAFKLKEGEISGVIQVGLSQFIMPIANVMFPKIAGGTGAEGRWWTTTRGRTGGSATGRGGGSASTIRAATVLGGWTPITHSPTPPSTHTSASGRQATPSDQGPRRVQRPPRTRRPARVGIR